MRPYLELVAEAYLAQTECRLYDCCFVFPNKRSATFFTHYLTGLLKGRPMLMPALATLDEVVSEFSDLVEAPRLEQLFTLYNEYTTLAGDVENDFEKFLYWGEMILADFNDVDRDLVDASKLFVNLKRYREIQSDYLTPEQREILSRYWGESFAPVSPGEFWQHLHEESPLPTEQKFLKLWEVLAPLYDRFTSTLRSRGKGNPGMMLREAVRRLRDKSVTLSSKRYVFVGFNVLSLGELRLFELLKVRDAADFYWDDSAPSFSIPGNRAAHFLRRNVRMFPSRYEIEPIEPGHFPKVEVTGIPSGVGQAKEAGRILKRWAREGALDFGDAINTAIVLPDENLLIPMVHAIPAADASGNETAGGARMPLNITMGLPMKATSLNSFISALVSLLANSTPAAEGGDTAYFYDDVRALAAHPLLRKLDPEGCNAVGALFEKERIYLIPSATLREVAPKLGKVFAGGVLSGDSERVAAYFDDLLRSLSEMLHDGQADDADEGDEPFAPPAETDGGSATSVEAYFIDGWLEALGELTGAIRTYNVDVKPVTFIRMLEKSISGATVRLEGQPLKGLQVMGVLETRSLDFDNLIFLSMNESVFPTKSFSRSFVPDTLRRAFGMASTDFQESIFGYYFYRLISRAKRVSLIYDARISGGRSSEPSRYVSQMLYLFPGLDITSRVSSFDLHFEQTDDIVIAKTPEIMKRLSAYTEEGGRSLSASSINTYINCPLQFYLRNVSGLYLDDDTEDNLSAASYGSIFHRILELIYTELRGDAPEVRIEADTLDTVMRRGVARKRFITQAVNEVFNRRKDGLDTPLQGEALVIGKVLDYMLGSILNAEKKFAPFDFIAAEYELRGRFAVSPDLTINICQFIDRIDRIYPQDHPEGVIRIVDYKTGSDKTDFKSVADLFDSENQDRRKAILQLLFYSNAYARRNNIGGAICPQIYKLKEVARSGFDYLKYNGEPLTDYREVNDEFLQEFSGVVSRIFDPSVPFTQTHNTHTCGYCTFREICGR